MNLYLIRHTRPDVATGICYGQTNLDTTETFKTEAETVKTNLKDIHFTHCYSSPLQRCFKLAQELSAENVIHTDDRLMEMNFGDWEMMTWDYIRKKEGAETWFNDFLHIPCPNGESYEQMIQRIQSFIQAINVLTDDSEVLIVTHAGCIRSFLTLLEGEDPLKIFNRGIEYGEIIKLTYNRP